MFILWFIHCSSRVYPILTNRMTWKTPSIEVKFARTISRCRKRLYSGLPCGVVQVEHYAKWPAKGQVEAYFMLYATSQYPHMGLYPCERSLFKICIKTYRLVATLFIFLQHQEKRILFSLYSLFFLYQIGRAVARPSAKIAFISNYIFLKSQPKKLKNYKMRHLTKEDIYRW